MAVTFAMDCRIPYLGFCLTPAHKSLLHTRLIQEVMSDSCREKDCRYDAVFAKPMAAQAATPKAEAKATEEKAKPKEQSGEKQLGKDLRTIGVVDSDN